MLLSYIHSFLGNTLIYRLLINLKVYLLLCRFIRWLSDHKLHVALQHPRLGRANVSSAGTGRLLGGERGVGQVTFVFLISLRIVQLLLLVVGEPCCVLDTHLYEEQGQDLRNFKDVEDSVDAKEANEVLSNGREKYSIDVEDRGGDAQLVVVQHFGHVDPEHSGQIDNIIVTYNKNEGADAVLHHRRNSRSVQAKNQPNGLGDHQVLSLESIYCVQTGESDEEAGDAENLRAKVSIHFVFGRHSLVHDCDYPIGIHKHYIKSLPLSEYPVYHKCDRATQVLFAKY